MFETIKYSVTFPTNGRTLEGEYTLSPGVTAVTGSNWAGKTFGAVEIPRYLLFGKEALRGPASDYKTLKAEGWVRIAGARYFISRSAKKEEITDEVGEVLAVNTKAVNEKLLELIGFPLEVFDLVCAARQKDSERLSQMTPGARKQLIDRVLGLTALERAEKACKEEAKRNKDEAAGKASMLREPVPVSLDKAFRPSEFIAGELKHLKEKLAEKVQLEKIVGRERPEPVKPDTVLIDNIDELVRAETERQERDGQRRAIERKLVGLDDPKYTTAELDAAEEINRRGPRPTTTIAELEAMDEEWELQEFGDAEVRCPECSHKFKPGEGVKPRFTRKEIAAEYAAHRSWPDEMIGPDLTASEIRDARGALEKTRLEKELLDLPPLPDHSEELEEKRALKSAWAVYDRDLFVWQEDQLLIDEARNRLELVTVTDEAVEALQEELSNSRVKEAALARYETDKANYDKDKAAIEAQQKAAAEFTEGAVALRDARGLVKAYLAPSLSRVASALIQQMTDGRLTEVLVDENMNILVDGQEVSTLSGAGATLANLALRIGLGQVLVTKVFPVFIGDELDADMDAENASATAEALYNLKDQLDQVILVTHKQPESADVIIRK